MVAACEYARAVRRALLAAAIAGLVLTGAGAASDDEPSAGCTADTGSCALLQLRSGGLMPYYRNRPLTGVQPGIRRAIVVVHGDSRIAEGALNSVVSAATSSQRSETIVIAPFFQPHDRTFQLRWKDGWKEGDLSTDKGPAVPRRSSFEIVDTFLTLLTNRASFPNLVEVVVAGHSAGGQLVQRYAATSSFQPPRGLRVRYVVSNPGSYMYLNNRRWLGGAFAVPPASLGAACSNFNRYRYGLDGRSGYVGEPSAAQILARFPSRTVTYLLGDADTKHDNLDDSCAAALQGKHRFDRGKTFLAFMNAFFPAHRHKLVIVPGGTHSASAMYTSPAGKQVLYAPVP
jgi:hypothetical protein